MGISREDFFILLPPKLRTLPWRRLRKKRVRQFRAGDGQFLLPQQHALEHETQDRKESYHGNCGKQVGE